jgi:putative hydrolase of the HAD superfamily
MPLRAVTFDCWQTLLVESDWTLAHARRVELLAEAARAAGRSDVPLVELTRVFDRAWGRHMREWLRGVATGAPEIADDALALLGIRPEPVVREQLIQAWQEASHTGRVEAVDGAVESLSALGDAGLRLGLVCDTGLTPGRIVRLHLDRVGLLHHLECCVFSDEIGVPKPDPRVFRTALRALGVEARDAAHVGDLLRTDVAGARTVGMHAIRLRAVHDDPSGLPEADLVADSHAALTRALVQLAIGREA